MKKISMPRIIVALCIINIYLFMYGIVGEIGNYPVAAETDTPASTDASQNTQDIQDNEDTAPNGMGTVDFLIDENAAETSVPKTVYVPAMSWYKPSVMDYYYETQNDMVTAAPNESSETSSESTPTEPITDELDFDEQTYDTYEETTAETTVPVTTVTEIITTTPAPVTTTTPEATTTPQITTVPSTTTTPPTTTTVPPTTTTPAPTAPVETTKATTTLKEIAVDENDVIVETIATSAPDTTPEPTTPSVSTPPPSSGSDVILTVSNGGVIVSGKAVDIISKIVTNEIGGSFDTEAIKAQAVAAYTFVSYFNKNNSTPSVILKDTVPDKVYYAVSSVIGQAVYYNGNLIQAVYSASSAGFTASSYNVWGSDLPYLRSVECDLDAKYDPNYGVVRSIPASTVKENVENVTGIKLTGEKKDWLYVESREDGQYVARMLIGGESSYMDGTRERNISGRVFRELIMSYGIRSAAFDVTYDEATDSFMFTTYGYGHGVGLSQNGAQALAVHKGYNYVQILQHYYQGCEIY